MWMWELSSHCQGVSCENCWTELSYAFFQAVWIGCCLISFYVMTVMFRLFVKNVIWTLWWMKRTWFNLSHQSHFISTLTHLFIPSFALSHSFTLFNSATHLFTRSLYIHLFIHSFVNLSVSYGVSRRLDSALSVACHVNQYLRLTCDYHYCVHEDCQIWVSNCSHHLCSHNSIHFVPGNDSSPWLTNWAC